MTRIQARHLCLLLFAASLLLLSWPALAKLHSFTPEREQGRFKVFRVTGIKTAKVKKARLVTRRGKRRFSAARVRRAARSKRHLLYVEAQRGGGVRKLEVRTIAGAAESNGTRKKSPESGVSEPPRGKKNRGKKPEQSAPAPEPEPGAPVYAVPASVPAGCFADATSSLLSWLASVPDNSIVSFPINACYRIEGTLELTDRSLGFDGNGAILRSFDPDTESRAIWRFVDSEITLQEMTIDGSYANGGVFTSALQHAHGIDLRGTDATISDVSISDVAGDCVYFGLGADRSSGVFRDSSCLRTGRNGVSVTAGDNIRVERVRTDDIGFISFDVEPNTAAGFGSDNVVFDGNVIGSYYLKAYTVIGNGPVTRQSFTNNDVVGQGLKIGLIDRAFRPQQLTIVGNSADTDTAPPAINADGVDGLTITGNSVPLSGGPLAAVDGSCNVQVYGNSFPGGSEEVVLSNWAGYSCP